MHQDLIAELAKPVPRYTSYPTSPHFKTDIDSTTYRGWLEALTPSARLSLYVHIPFCDTLCWFCACSTKIVQRYKPVEKYCDFLNSEIRQTAQLVPEQARVSHLHLGGGSPDILTPDDILRLSDTLHSHFQFEPDAEFATEIDPRAMDAHKIAAFVHAGLTRISLGVQDFDPAVQVAINRQQSQEITSSVIESFRSQGIKSVNIDLVYGLPSQTKDTALKTIDAVIDLDPDRVALFGYAHLPEKITHQRLIDTESVPDVNDRFALAQIMSSQLVDAGYVRIGMDHFCKPEDTMAQGELRRNFQGYTTDAADALIGFGASAIGQLPQGYVQNAVPIGEYQRRIEQGDFATVRGFTFSQEDKARAFAIEKLMCEMHFPARELKQMFGDMGSMIAAEGERMAAADHNQLLQAAPDGFIVAEKGRPYLRTICSWLDAYLETSKAIHSTGI